MRNLIFLDIDGVLNNDASLAEGIHLCSDKVILLRNFCEQYDCDVVISSSWRIGRTLKELTEILAYVGFWCDKRIIGTTPVANKDDINFRGCERGYEIEQWLQNQKGDYNYLILDDDADMLEYQTLRFLQIDPALGLVSPYIKKMKEILGIL